MGGKENMERMICPSQHLDGGFQIYWKLVVLESSPTRLSQLSKAQFTVVNEHFERKSNEVGALSRQTLSSGNYLVVLVCDGQIIDSKNLQIQ